MLVKLVAAEHLLFDIKMIEQLDRDTRIFSQYQMAFS
jgi:hypothetical protein